MYLLIFRFRIENVVVALQRRACPNVRCRESASPYIVKIGYENFMIDKRPHLPWSHVMNAVQIRNIHGTCVWSGVLLVVLVDIETEQHDVHSVKILEHNYALAPEGKFVRVFVKRVPLLNPFLNFKPPVHRSYLTNRNSASHL